MLNNIEFKVWDKLNKEMLEIAMLRFENGKDISRIAAYHNNGEHNGWTDYFFDGRFVLLQYIGMKDKNNKKIYIGDIYQFPNFRNLNETITEIVTDSFSFYKNLDKYSMSSNDVEVIGNRYENSDLSIIRGFE